jgi:peroxiredoxin
MKLRRIVRGVAVVAAVALVATGCAGKDAVDAGSSGNYRYVSGTSLGTTYPVADRKPAENFTGALLNGGTITLAEQAGKVVVINFWATWCPPCVVETPQFDNVYRAYRAKGVSFIGIDTKDNQDSARSFVAHNQISYPIVFDERGETALRLGQIPAGGLPFTVIIDRHGKVAVVYLNSMAPKDLEPLLVKLLAEP